MSTCREPDFCSPVIDTDVLVTGKIIDGLILSNHTRSLIICIVLEIGVRKTKKATSWKY